MVITKEISLHTRGHTDVEDITDQIIFLDFDTRPRARQRVGQVIGE